MKKLTSIIITLIMILSVFTVSAYSQDLYDGDFYVNVIGGSEKVVIDWDDFYTADCYKVSINTEIEYHCAEGVVTESCFNWVPDYSVTPNEVFDITVYAYDNSGALIAQSNVVQLYIVTYMCDYFGYYGNVDGDDMPTVIDATVVQNYLARDKYFNAMEEQMADVDSDGKITVMDATFIQQFCAQIYNSSNRTGQYAMIGWAEYEVHFDNWWEA